MSSPTRWPERRGPIESREETLNKEILERLKRIEGQVRGLQRMIEEQRPCTDVVTQILAARSALEQVGVQLLDQQLYQCIPSDDPGLAQIKRALRLWIKLGTGA